VEPKTSDDEGDEVLAEVMARLAEGDGAAILTLRERFRAPLVRAVRGQARRRGARLAADDLEEVLTDVVVELARVAPGWDPAGGAPPWVWAHHQVGAVVDRHLGQWADVLDPDAEVRQQAGPPAAAGQEAAVLDVLAGLAQRQPVLALLQEAVALVASDRDQALFFEVAIQEASGDRSHAASVAQLYGLRPEAVRQQTRRVRQRLRRLAQDEPRFAELATLAVVA